MKKCLFVFNQFSGKGKIKKKKEFISFELSKVFEVESFSSECKGDIFDVISVKGEEFDIVVVAGGDGTISEAVNALCRLKKKVTLGIIPSGTVNDVAHSLGIQRSIKGALKNIIEGETFKHDALKINDRFGIYVCCAGMFTSSSYATEQSTKRKFGKLAYALKGAEEIFSTPAIKVKLTTKIQSLEQNCSILLILNSRHVAGFNINKKAVLNDGLVDVVLIKNKKEMVRGKGFWETIKLFLLGIKKKSTKNCTHLLLDEFDVEMKDGNVVNLDGESVGKGNFHCKVIKNAIEIIVPRKKGGYKKFMLKNQE